MNGRHDHAGEQRCPKLCRAFKPSAIPTPALKGRDCIICTATSAARAHPSVVVPAGASGRAPLIVGQGAGARVARWIATMAIIAIRRAILARLISE